MLLGLKSAVLNYFIKKNCISLKTIKKSFDIKRNLDFSFSTGLKDWEKRLIISDRAHLGK